MTEAERDQKYPLPLHRIVRVELGVKSYNILIGRGLMPYLGRFIGKHVIGGDESPVVLISDRNVLSLKWSEDIRNPWHSWGLLDGVIPGEESKSMKTASELLSALAKFRLPRSGTLIALGGGVIGDLAGFVAATYLRGINFVQVPTTLLAMVDSSVGGKTGVNLPEGKNLVGAFHQPKLVVADLDTLATLPAKEFSAGMAEVIKYGAIRDKALFDRVSRPVKPDDADLDEIVEKCVSIKARIVERDEFETKGERALLNFGHTIGHAIEKATEYKSYLHGEAISLGMRAAAWLSRRDAGLSQEDARDLDLALIANNLPVVLDKEVDSQSILAALGNDKKVAADGVNRWVLLTKLGQAESGRVVSPALVEQAVEYLRTHPDDL